MVGTRLAALKTSAAAVTPKRAPMVWLRTSPSSRLTTLPSMISTAATAIPRPTAGPIPGRAPLRRRLLPVSVARLKRRPQCPGVPRSPDAGLQGGGRAIRGQGQQDDPSPTGPHHGGLREAGLVHRGPSAGASGRA